MNFIHSYLFAFFWLQHNKQQSTDEKSLGHFENWDKKFVVVINFSHQSFYKR